VRVRRVPLAVAGACEDRLCQRAIAVAERRQRGRELRHGGAQLEAGMDALPLAKRMDLLDRGFPAGLAWVLGGGRSRRRENREEDSGCRDRRAHVSSLEDYPGLC
jgi:hypothetical protein